MSRHRFFVLIPLIMAVVVFGWGIYLGMSSESQAASPTTQEATGDVLTAPTKAKLRTTTPKMRQEAAARAALCAKAAPRGKMAMAASQAAVAAAVPGGTPDYFGTAPNYANSPLPTVNPTTKVVTGGIRKFVDTLAGVGSANANNLGQYIPIASADTTTFPGSDYYQIGLVDYTQQMHSDLPATKLRGYKDLRASGTDGKAHYLGPIIIAQRDRPTRIKFTNMLGTGAAGSLFLPVDTSCMGAGTGPDLTHPNELYTQNRAVLHLHGGVTPWISDGTPHQWITPAGETTSYPKGVSQQNVPDMPDPGAGSATFYYSNQQSNRLMFYHDHSYGMTRLNVYAGEAAGYLLTDSVEEDLISVKKVLPDLGGVYHLGIPLIIQDKTFVPGPAAVAAQDPTWDPVKWGGLGNLWFPHVYMPNQNPSDPMGVNAMGRWDYGPWFWPPIDPSLLAHPPVASVPGGALDTPGTPNPSMVPEAFMDTPVVNGVAYPVLPVQRKAYRFRILNACNDRYLNLQLYYVDPTIAKGAPGYQKEVKMVPAVPHPVTDLTWPATWPTDGRDGGVPDPTLAGPSMIQIGTEGGFLSAPVVLPNTPIGYNYNRRDITVLNVANHTLFLGPAERADVIIDFSGVPDGAKLILYNDAPAPVPAFDPRNDYYTGDPDQTSTGGAPSTLPGYGPNTRTIMQFQVSGATAAAAFDLNALKAAWPAAYAASQPPPIVPQIAYGAATDTFSRIDSTSLTYTPVGASAPVTTPLQPKAIQELFELNYGRMNATLGVELPFTNFNTQTTIPLGYIDPPTETLAAGQVQIWKITHNGVDTHAIHFHLFNVQLVNRVGWDGMVKPPEPNERGWKETVRMNPLEDAIVAITPIVPKLPFTIPDSIRLLDPTMPLGSTMGFSGIDPLTGNAVPGGVSNVMTNFGWEYVWHCHLLGHEENDMMRPMVITGANGYYTSVAAPSGLSAAVGGPALVNLTWANNANNQTGFRIERATGTGAFAALGTVAANATTYPDTTAVLGTTYSYRVFAYNGGGDSLPSNTVIITVAVPPAPSSLLATPSVLSATPPTVGLTWTDNSNNEAGFTIQRAMNSGFTSGLTTFTVGANVTAYNDTSVLPKTKYYYKVQATNVLGKSAFTSPAIVTTAGQLPAAPTNLQFVSATRTSVTMSWTDNATNESGFKVQKALAGPNGPWTTVTTIGPKTATPPSTVTHTMTKLSANSPHWFRVQAYNADGTTAFTNVISAPTLP